MSPRITRLIKNAFSLPRHPRAMSAIQRQLYRATKRAYVKGSPSQRANLLSNAAVMAAQA